MSEYYGGDYLYTALSTDTALLALLGGEYSFNARMVPETCASRKTVNFYATTPMSPRLEYFEARWSADCRGDTETDAIDIAGAVVAVLNRQGAIAGSKQYFSVVDMIGVIPPADNTDQYNCPVQIYLRRRA